MAEQDDGSRSSRLMRWKRPWSGPRVSPSRAIPAPVASPSRADAARRERAGPSVEPTSVPAAAPPSTLGGVIDERAAQKNLDFAGPAHPVEVWNTQAHFEADHCVILRRKTQGACIVVIYGAELQLGRKYGIAGREMTIGRDPTNDICVHQDSVSRTHATITADDTGVKIRDNQSAHGTYVNDDAIHEAYLKDGDLIHVGRSIFKFLTGYDVESSYHEEIYRLSTVDGLTQIFNRRYFTDTLGRELSRARRYDRPLALMMFDIDGFQRCNDTYGHRAGDHVLRQLAELVRDRARKVDVVARYDGQEFAVILPEIDLHAAAELAEAIRSEIEQARFMFDDQPIAVTISVGAAELEPHSTTSDDLVEAAAARLARAKASGGNRVVASDGDDVPAPESPQTPHES